MSGPLSREPEWQRLWFSLQRQPWRSLAVLGTDGSTDAGLVARTLAAIGTRDGQTPVRVLSATGVSFPDVPRIISQMCPFATPGEESPLTVVACDGLDRNPAMIPIVQQASGVVLVVRLGQARLHSIRTTVAQVGRERVLATISLGEAS